MLTLIKQDGCCCPQLQQEPDGHRGGHRGDRRHYRRRHRTGKRKFRKGTCRVTFEFGAHWDRVTLAKPHLMYTALSGKLKWEKISS